MTLPAVLCGQSCDHWHCTAALKLYRDRAEHTGLFCRSAVVTGPPLVSGPLAVFYNWVDKMRSGWHNSCFLAVQCCQLFYYQCCCSNWWVCDVEWKCQIPNQRQSDSHVNDQLDKVLILCTGFAIQLKRNRSVTKTHTDKQKHETNKMKQNKNTWTNILLLTTLQQTTV